MNPDTAKKILTQLSSDEPLRHVTKPCRTCGRPTPFVEGAVSTRLLRDLADRYRDSTSAEYPDSWALCEQCDASLTAAAMERATPRLNAGELAKASGMPDVDSVQLLHVLEDWVASPSRAVLVTGTKNSKQPAALIRHWSVERRQRSVYRSTAAMATALRDVSTRYQEMHRLKSAPLLVLDDLGVGTRTDFLTAAWHEILIARTRHRDLRTAFFSSYPASTLRRVPTIDAEVWRRIEQLVESTTIEVRAGNE